MLIGTRWCYVDAGVLYLRVCRFQLKSVTDWCCSLLCVTLNLQVAEFENHLRTIIQDVKLVQIEATWQQQEWAKQVTSEGFQDADLMRASLDKAVCSLATVFLGTHSSTFTHEIASLRHLLKTAVCVDSLICANPPQQQLGTA